MRNSKSLLRVLALTAVLSLFTVGVAYADGFVDDTSLPIHVSDLTVEPGTTVDITGHLQAIHAFCRSAEVTLRAYGENNGEPFPAGIQKRTQTGQAGRFSFHLLVNEQMRIRVWFRGQVGGTHPIINVCRKSRSETFTIRVS